MTTMFVMHNPLLSLDDGQPGKAYGAGGGGGGAEGGEGGELPPLTQSDPSHTLPSLSHPLPMDGPEEPASLEMEGLDNALAMEVGMELARLASELELDTEPSNRLETALADMAEVFEQAARAAPEVATVAASIRTLSDRMGKRGAGQSEEALETIRMAWELGEALGAESVVSAIGAETLETFRNNVSGARAPPEVPQPQSRTPAETAAAAAAEDPPRDFEAMLVQLHARLRPVSSLSAQQRSQEQEQGQGQQGQQQQRRSQGSGDGDMLHHVLGRALARLNPVHRKSLMHSTAAAQRAFHAHNDAG